MTNVIDFTGPNVGPVPPEQVLDGAKGCSTVLVIGWDEKDEFFMAASEAEIGELLILLELAKRDVLGHVTETD